MKAVLLILAVSLLSPLAKGEEAALRYDGFVFTPDYTSRFDGMQAILEQELSEFHHVTRIHTATIDGSGLALYRVDVKKERLKEFVAKRSYKEVVLKQKREESDRNKWDAVSFVDHNGETNLLLKSTKYDDFCLVRKIRG